LVVAAYGHYVVLESAFEGASALILTTSGK